MRAETFTATLLAFGILGGLVIGAGAMLAYVRSVLGWPDPDTAQPSPEASRPRHRREGVAVR